MSELKCLNKEEIIKANIDKQQAIIKKLIIDDNYDLYLNVQALYKKVFDNYLEKLIPINNIIDETLKNCNLDYGKLEENRKNIYQKFSYLNSDYLFVRNFFYIERLDEKYLNKFIEKIKRNCFSIDDEIIEMVKLTYKDIIKVISKKTTETFKTFYGITTPNFLFDNDSLVLFINYGKNTINLQGKEFIDNKIKKEKYLDKLIKEIKLIFEEKLDCKTEVKYYKGVIV